MRIVCCTKLVGFYHIWTQQKQQYIANRKEETAKALPSSWEHKITNLRKREENALKCFPLLLFLSVERKSAVGWKKICEEIWNESKKLLFIILKNIRFDKKKGWGKFLLIHQGCDMMNVIIVKCINLGEKYYPKIACTEKFYILNL